MSLMFFGMSMVSNDVQSQKALPSIFVTVSGIVNDFKDEHSSNAW